MTDRLARDWRTRPVEREVTVVTVGVGAKPVVTVVLCADGSVRVEHQLPESATVRVSRDGPARYQTESKVAPPYGAVALLREEETGG